MSALGPGTADKVRLIVEEEFGPGYWDGFQAYMTDDLPWHEWRFGGQLGFGGKVHYNGLRLYVSGYPFDLDEDLEGAILRVNEQLADVLREAA